MGPLSFRMCLQYPLCFYVSTVETRELNTLSGETGWNLPNHVDGEAHLQGWPHGLPKEDPACRTAPTSSRPAFFDLDEPLETVEGPHLDQTNPDFHLPHHKPHLQV